MSYQDAPAFPITDQISVAPRKTYVPSLGLELDGSIALLFAASMIEMIKAANECDVDDAGEDSLVDCELAFSCCYQ